MEGQENLSIKSNTLFTNFIIFSLTFSITHATVDSVLAYSSAELGTNIGSSGGFVLYIFYTVSALLVAKPFLSYFHPKNSVMIGLICMLAYVSSFFLAVLIPSIATFIFLLGASFGGVGAGILWTAQGSF